MKSTHLKYATRRLVRQAFSLVEILVVIAIIALLVGLLTPLLSKARRHAHTVRCAAALHGIGAGWTAYRQQFADGFPPVASLPPASGSAGAGAVSFMGCLDRFVQPREAYRCAGDDRGYFEQRGTSYEYLPGLLLQLNPANQNLLLAFAKHHAARVPVLSDAEAFHPAAHDPTRRQTLYYDGHVDWWHDEDFPEL